MGITIFKSFILGGISSLTRRRKTFPTIYPTIYLPNENFEYSYPLIGRIHIECNGCSVVIYNFIQSLKVNLSRDM